MKDVNKRENQKQWKKKNRDSEMGKKMGKCQNFI